MRGCAASSDDPTLTFLAAAGAEQVHSFEPIPETFCRLEKNVVANRLGNICSLNCLAVGTDFGLLTFAVNDRSPATNRMAASQVAPKRDQFSSQKVASISLEKYCELSQIRQIDLLKIDVEGMECLVLDGAQRLFKEKRVRYGLIEVCPGNLRTAGFDAAILHARIRAVGYRPFRLKDDGTIKVELTSVDFEEIAYENVAIIAD